MFTYSAKFGAQYKAALHYTENPRVVDRGNCVVNQIKETDLATINDDYHRSNLNWFKLCRYNKC